MTYVRYWAIPEKNRGGGGGGGGGWNFQGEQKKSMRNFQELIKGKVEFPRRVTKKKNLGLKFPRDLTQSCGISRGEALFCLEFPRVHEGFQKSMPSTPLFVFFWNTLFLM